MPTPTCPACACLPICTIPRILKKSAATVMSLLFAVPSGFVRSTARKAAPHIPGWQLIVDVAKGVEEKTLIDDVRNH